MQELHESGACAAFAEPREPVFIRCPAQKRWLFFQLVLGQVRFRFYRAGSGYGASTVGSAAANGRFVPQGRIRRLP